MSDQTIKVQVIELPVDKLKPDSKYIFLLDPQYESYIEMLGEELARLIGDENFTILSASSDALKIYAIQPEGDT